MAYTLALLTNVKPRVIEILGANPNVWGATVSGRVGAFPTDNEILALCLEADEMVCTQGYFGSVNATLSQPFMVMSSSPIPSGENIPFTHGRVHKVELKDGSTWSRGVLAKSLDDVLNVDNSYVEADAFKHLYFVEDGNIYHNADDARCEYPEFIRKTDLQANKNEESLIIATAIRLATKNASPAPFEFWANESMRGIAQLQAEGLYTDKSGGNS